MLLIHPPVAKPCEPPAGIARLAGALRTSGVECTLLDANLEGQLALLAGQPVPQDTWGKRAHRSLTANINGLHNPALYRNPARYRRTVADVNRMLALAGRASNISLSLANYQDPALSPLKSDELLRASEHPDRNIFFPYFSQRLPRVLAEKQPGLVGFSLNYLSQAATTFAMLGFLKRLAPDLPLILGGGLVTSWLRNPAWQDPFAGLIDHLVAGPGERALLELAGRSSGPAHIRPDYAGLPLAGYLAPGFILPYAASSGCYWNKCSFCPEKAEKNPYAALAAGHVLADIQRLGQQNAPVLLHLLDNAIRPDLMEAFASRPPGMNWYGFARITAALTDTDYCRALRRSGCIMLKIGLESADPAVLEAMHKGIEPDMVSRALAALKQAGIATYVYLLFGTPAESIDEARRTQHFIVRHADSISFLNLAIFNMPVCSPEAHSIQTSNFYEGDLSLYTDFEHPRGWNRQAIRRFLDQEFKRQPEIAAIIRRDPPQFTSNHAPFFADSMKSR